MNAMSGNRRTERLLVACAPAMKKLAPLALLVLAAGCRMCANSCDDSPVVAGGPPLGLSRAGSNLGGGYYASEPVPMPAVADQAVPAVTDPAIESAPQLAP